MINGRASGILLHVTSVPSPFGIGDLGPEAYRFVDFLAETGQSYWQILPLTPTAIFTANSPYSTSAAFAGNPLLISPQLLVDEGWVEQEEADSCRASQTATVDYETVTKRKRQLLRRAYDRNRDRVTTDAEFARFGRDNRAWLEAESLFVALKDRFGGIPFTAWPADIRDREEAALNQWRQNLADRIVQEQFAQFLFHKQWFALKKYANGKGIRIIGDLPIYVSHDSADVWRNPDVFKLDKDKEVSAVAGVPPDYFSETGQLWGNPVYDWDALEEREFDWWLWRIEHTLKLFDVFRLDHFRGFVAYWEVPVGEKTAVNGKWVKVPVARFFDALLKKLSQLPMIAEDLGTITDDVRAVMKKHGFPGMKILQFAFSGDMKTHPYLPHNYDRNCVVYTGTHDNNTTRGWLEDRATEEEIKRIEEYLGAEADPADLRLELITLAMKSKADTAIIPMQDILGLGSEARMNTPATVDHNWSWRMLPDAISTDHRTLLLQLTRQTGRVSNT